MRYYLVNVADIEHTTFRVAATDFPLPAGTTLPEAPSDPDHQWRKPAGIAGTDTQATSPASTAIVTPRPVQGKPRR